MLLLFTVTFVKFEMCRLQLRPIGDRLPIFDLITQRRFLSRIKHVESVVTVTLNRRQTNKQKPNCVNFESRRMKLSVHLPVIRNNNDSSFLKNSKAVGQKAKI